MILTTAEEAEAALPGVWEQPQQEELTAHSPTLCDTGSLDLLRYQHPLDCAVSASPRQKSRQAAEPLEGPLAHLAQRLLHCCFAVGLQPDPKGQVVPARLVASPYREQGVHPQPADLKNSLPLSISLARTYRSSQLSSSEYLWRYQIEARPRESLVAIPRAYKVVGIHGQHSVINTPNLRRLPCRLPHSLKALTANCLGEAEEELPRQAAAVVEEGRPC